MKILHLEDNPADAELTRAMLRTEDATCEIHTVSQREAFIGALQQQNFDAILSDYSLPDFDGISALELARRLAPDTPFIFFSGSIGEDRAIAALHAGAADYVLKDRIQRLCPVIRRAIHEAHERRSRRAAEHQLQVSQARYQRLIEEARDAIFSLSSTGVITSLNPAFGFLTGWPHERWLGRHFSDLIHPEDRTFALERFQKVITGASLPAFELRVKTAGGTAVFLEFTVTLNRDEAGALEVLGIGRDITERRRAEQLAREQAEIIDQSPAAIVITDLRHRVTYCNSGARQLYGLTTEELVGHTADQLFPPETMQHLAAGRAACLAHGHWHGEVPVVTRDGRRLATDFFMNLIYNEDGSPRARLSIAVDVTEKKKLEEQFLRAQRMENLGLLAAGIAHDFNNVLAPVLMISQLLRARLPGTAEQKLVATLEESANRGASLVKQILGFAHGTSGERAPLQAKHLARDVVAFVESTFPRSITLEAHIASDLWPVRANATQLHQVLLNLCVNARDAMPDGGILRLTLANAILDPAAAAALPGARPGTFIHLCAADSGTGIPADILSRIWEPFFTTKQAGKGTGLGLSTVRGIVTAHGGFCYAANAAPCGAEFHVYLPAEDTAVAPSAPDAPATPPPRGAGETILIVDDEAAVRDTVETALLEHGFRVLVATDGMEAITTLETMGTPAHVVVTDLNMPRLDGHSFIALLRKFYPTSRIVVISGSDSAQRAAAAPGDAYLPKPFQVEALVQTIHRLLHTSRP